MIIQCTRWMKKDLILKLGKVNFLYPEDSSWQEIYNVPYPKRIMTAQEWCQKHAEYVNGWIVEKNGKIAVFRENYKNS